VSRTGPRSLALVLAWLLAAGASLAVAWRGVAVVGDQVTHDRPAPLSADELQAAGAESPTTTTDDDGSSGSGDGSTSTTSPGDAAPETRSYTLVGGAVTLRFAPSGVTLVVATPNPGFEVETEPTHGTGIRVELEGDDHRSRIDAWWDGGPQVEPREEADGGGGGGGGDDDSGPGGGD
jgi:hypothetical protein